MDPIQLFQLLEHKPLGPSLFRTLLLGRRKARTLMSWLLEEWIRQGLPGTAWALQCHQGLHANAQRDLSQLRYLQARLDAQPD